VNDRVVCDASAVVAMLLDDGPHGRWAAEALSAKDLYAPSLLPFECANVIRRQELSGTVSTDQAVQAHADLCDFDVELWPHDVLANRIWRLRANLSCYDAAYVALAELLDASLVTLDRRISGAPGLQCRVLQPS
jgi:predicted nucleic acid-binding protein